MSKFNGMTKTAWVSARKAVFSKYKDQGASLVSVAPDGETSVRVSCQYSEIGTKRITVGNIKDFS